MSGTDRRSIEVAEPVRVQQSPHFSASPSRLYFFITADSVRNSRHQYGDAADVYPMVDLTGDGIINHEDRDLIENKAIKAGFNEVIPKKKITVAKPQRIKLSPAKFQASSTPRSS